MIDYETKVNLESYSYTLSYIELLSKMDDTSD